MEDMSDLTVHILNLTCVNKKIPKPVETGLGNSGLVAQSESESVEREAVEAMRKRLPQIEREIDNLIELAAKTGAGRTIPEKLRALERERELLALQIEDMESRAPLIEPDMVRYPLFQLRKCSGPDSIVRGFVDRIEVDENGGMLVIFNLCTPSDLRKPQNGEPQNAWFAKLSFGSPYRIRTGDLRLERAAS